MELLGSWRKESKQVIAKANQDLGEELGAKMEELVAGIDEAYIIPTLLLQPRFDAGQGQVRLREVTLRRVHEADREGLHRAVSSEGTPSATNPREAST